MDLSCQGASEDMLIETRNSHFISDSDSNDNANLSYNEDYIQKLAYLVETSEKLIHFSKSMQDP
jgi:hypothetical protein